MKTFVVLGMHRSATSLMAKGLHDNAVAIGDDLLPATECNQYGHWEDRAFIRMNQAILQAAGGSWDDPPSELDIMMAGADLAQDIRNLVMSRREDLWGWKDPRTTLTVRCYLPYLTHPHFFCAFRDVRSVASSLQRRDKMPFDKAARLAHEYNRRLLGFLREWYLGCL